MNGNFRGKIIVYEKKGKFRVRVVTLLDDGNETIDYCTLEEITQAINSSQQARQAMSQNDD